MNLIFTFQNGSTSLDWAAEKNNVAIAELLIMSGANIRAKDNVPLLSLQCFVYDCCHIWILYDHVADVQI